MSKFFRSVAWMLFLLLVFAFGPQFVSAQASSAVEKSKGVTHYLEVETLAPKRPFWVATKIDIDLGKYGFWRSPASNSENKVTQIQWRLPEGFELGEVRYSNAMLENGELVYRDDFYILTEILPPRSEFGLQQAFDVEVEWQSCGALDGCETHSDNQRLWLNWGKGLPNPEVASIFAFARSIMPHPSPWPVEITVDDEYGRIGIFADQSLLSGLENAAFFLFGDSQNSSEAVSLVWSATQIGIAFSRAENADYVAVVSGLLILKDQLGQTHYLIVSGENSAPRTFNFSAQPQSPNISSEPFILFFAFVGGLILNLMPCVFPILAMKAVSFAAKGGESERARSLDSFFYFVGVVLSFLAVGGVLVGLRSIGYEIGWGFQLQAPSFVYVLILIMCTVILNFLGIFDIGFRFQGAGSGVARKEGNWGSFATGVLATLVATPCTAPFMAPAIAFALTTNLALSMGIFAALGVGMALPYVLISHSQFIRNRLPAPGSWMVRFKRYLSIPLALTVGWLLWVLSLQVTSFDFYLVLVSLMGLFSGLFLWGRMKRALLGQLLIIAVLFPLMRLNIASSLDLPPMTQEQGIVSVPYSEDAVARLRAEKRPIFINVTAAWCITCLVHERLIFSTDGFQDFLKSKGVVYMVADWTKPNDEIAALLTRHNRSGIPFYLYYPSGGVRPPILLPELLTGQIIQDTINGNL